MIAAPLLALALAAGPSCGLPPLAPGERPWKTGETLTYDLDVLGVVKAGTFQLSVERPMSAGEIVPLRARAKTTSSVANVKRFAAVALSWVDATTLLPERYRDESEEDGVRKSSDARIRPPAAQLVIQTQVGDKTASATFPREGEVLDGLSAIAYLRAARTAPGERYCLDLVANRRFWRMEATVAAKPEKVETPAGKFDTFRIDATLRRADRPAERPRPVHLWLTRDARRLPVAIVSEVDIGPVRAMLSGTRGTR